VYSETPISQSARNRSWVVGRRKISEQVESHLSKIKFEGQLQTGRINSTKNQTIPQGGAP
jgi:hypothetical protein